MVKAGLGAGLVGAKAAKMPSIFWSARYRKVRKATPHPRCHYFVRKLESVENSFII